MILRPCLHCAYKDGCSIKADILARARGAGLKLSSASFPCPERWKGFEIGRRVTVAFRHFGHDSTGERCWWGEPTAGTIFGHVDWRIRIWLDAPTDRGHLVVRVHPDFAGLKLLNETRSLCKECGRPEGGGMRPERTWFCDTCTPEPPNKEDEHADVR